MKQVTSSKRKGCQGKPLSTDATHPPGSPARRRNIMIVDDHPLMRIGLAQIIGAHPGLTVCCEEGDPALALQRLEKCVPDLLIADLSMPGIGGLEMIKNIHALYPRLPVLVVSMHEESVHAEHTLHAGARGYVMKDAGRDTILQAIERVLDNSIYVSPAMAEKIFHRFAHRGSALPMESLTDRELEVLELLGQGKSSKEIGAQLHLSGKTVDSHRNNLKHKLQCADSTALMRFAICWYEEERRCAQPACLDDHSASPPP